MNDEAQPLALERATHIVNEIQALLHGRRFPGRQHRLYELLDALMVVWSELDTPQCTPTSS